MTHRSIRSLILTALVALAALAAIPWSAAAQQASPAACPPLSPEAIEARVQEFAVAVNAEDLDRLSALLAPDHQHHWSGETLDRDTYLDRMGALFDAYDDYSFTTEQIITGDGEVALRFTASGTLVRPFNGIGGNDTSATWTGILIFTLDDCGQVTEIWAAVDHLGRLRQHGAITLPEATPAT